MRFKLIIAFVDDQQTADVVDASRRAGATGVTVVTRARGEGLQPAKTFLGLSLDTQRDVLLLLVEQHLSRHILETIGRTAHFDTTSGTGIAFQIDVEDAIGVAHQIEKLTPIVEQQL